jgi:hypothetical protein
MTCRSRLHGSQDARMPENVFVIAQNTDTVLMEDTLIGLVNYSQKLEASRF